jgi:O-antigen/teichoic acid export membrane protein
MSIKGQAIKGVKWTTISTVLFTITGILKISILTRFLDKSDFGLMALVAFVIAFVNLFNDMGITSAILHKQNISKKEYASLYWLNLLIGFIMFGILWLLTPLIADFYKQNRLNVLIPLLGLSLIISSIGTQFKIIESKNLLFKQISIVEMFSSIVSLTIAVFLAVKGWGVLSLVYSSLVQITLSNILFLIIGIKKYGLLLHYKFSETRAFLKIGIYQVGGQVVNQFNRDLDILIIGKFFPTDILGGYSLAKQLVFQPASAINPILVKVASPALAKFQNDLQKLKFNYLKLINILSSINIPLYILLIIFSPFIVQILYGNSFENVVILVQILSVYMILRSIGNPIGCLVIATGRTDLEFFWNLFTIIITPVFIVIAAKFGIIEVAISITIGMMILYVPSWKFLIQKMTGATLKEYFNSCFILNYNRLLVKELSSLK